MVSPPSDLGNGSIGLNITCLTWRAFDVRLTSPLALDALPPNITDGEVLQTCLSGSQDPRGMDRTAIPPSSNFARSVEDWDSPSVPSQADEPKQAGQTTPNGGQAWPSAHPVMGSTDLQHRPQWVDTKDGGVGVFYRGR